MSCSTAKQGKLHLIDTNGEVELFKIDFETILAFTTGAPHPPSTGFTKPPTIAFQDEGPHPRSNTGSNTLYLPTIKPLPSSDEYAYYVTILNAAEFGRV